MMLGRRRFVSGTVLVAVATAFSRLLPRKASAQPASPLTEPVPGAGDVTLSIAGWDTPSAGDQVWVSVSRSWRSAWR